MPTTLPSIDPPEKIHGITADINPEIFTEEQKRRFHAELQHINQCHIWPNSVSRGGYGKLRINKIHYAAHRLAYVLAKGRIPQGLCVLHQCDTPRCCNPDHLFLGTRADNAKDRDSKNRLLPTVKRGEDNRSKLKENDVRAIRVMRQKGVFYKTIAAKFSIGTTTVRAICSLRKWKHVQ